MGELRVLDDLRVDHGLAKEMVFQEEVESMARSGEVIRLAEATYRNVLRQHTWNHEALDTVNSNIVDQHSQMREELQSRHQDVVDDVNQYSFCLTNHLLKEIIEKALRGRVAPLSSQCMELLRSESNFPSGIRKLRDGTSSPQSLVVWDDDSVVGMLRSAVDMMKGRREQEIGGNEGQNRQAGGRRGQARGNGDQARQAGGRGRKVNGYGDQAGQAGGNDGQAPVVCWALLTLDS